LIKTFKRKMLGGIRFSRELVPSLRRVTSQKLRWQALQENGLVTVGAHTYGLPNVLYWNYQTKLEIGKYCSIAEGAVFLLGGEHRGDWVTTYPFAAFPLNWPTAVSYDQHTIGKGNIRVGNDVWIGHGAIVISGVTIGNGAIVGAGSVVTKNVEDFAVVAGNPARFIKFRFDEETRTWLSNLAWWDWSDAKVSRNIDKLMKPPADHNFEIM
jgi:acetyltransferase-like isoleucine patch superfamily enzyme